MSCRTERSCVSERDYSTDRCRRVYVCHPFSGDPEGNAARVRGLCRKLHRQGVLPIAPQIYLPQFVDEATERVRAMELCIHLLELCDAIYVYGTHLTTGMRKELWHASSKGMDVQFMGTPADHSDPRRPPSGPACREHADEAPEQPSSAELRQSSSAHTTAVPA